MTKMKLSQILRRDLELDPEVSGVTSDSRKVGLGDLFCALPGSVEGSANDGRNFIQQAIAQGACAILAPHDTKNEGSVVVNVADVRVADVRRAYALAAKTFYGAQPKTCVAITGTNGKTSVASFCRQMWASIGAKSASIGTLGVVKQSAKVETAITQPGLTTPDAADLAKFMYDLAQDGVTHLAIEASSHGIDQRRLDGVSLAAAGFTNLTQDHLDYHHSMQAYRQSKLRLFEQLLPRGKTAVINSDSDAYNVFAAASIMSGQNVMSIGERGQHLSLTSRVLVPDGQILHVNYQGRDYQTRLPLAGLFQASNALVAAGLLLATGEEIEAVMDSLSWLKGARGRMELVGTKSNSAQAYVDYAHTPDGLETVLKSLRPHTTGRLICVFGCGGDRDKGKRPLMGAIASRLADIVIITDDNPRSEDANTIRAEVASGANGEHISQIGDRKTAIYEATSMLKRGDVLVVAGKGHEQGQIVGQSILPFDDVSVVRDALLQ